jgi:DNA-binding MarR family transcriptional regulator
VPEGLSDQDYERLLAFRSGLRRFLRWSEEQAVAVGLTPVQHQLLLAVRGHPDELGPTVGDVAESLQLRHHSVVGLVDRAAGAGLVVRRPDAEDHRRVRLRLTPLGARRLGQLSRRHLEELGRLETRLRSLAGGAPDRAGA